MAGTKRTRWSARFDFAIETQKRLLEIMKLCPTAHTMRDVMERVVYNYLKLLKEQLEAEKKGHRLVVIRLPEGIEFPPALAVNPVVLVDLKL